MVLADGVHVESDLVRQLDLGDEVAETLADDLRWGTDGDIPEATQS